MTKVGIVILNYKDAATTKHLCEMIKDYSNIHHIVVVDNLSPDDSFEELQKFQSDKVDVIQSDKNGGYSYGNNYGAFYLIDKYGVDIIFIANPDVEFTSEFVADMVAAIESSEVDATSGVMLDAQGKLSDVNCKLLSLSEELLACTVFTKQFFKPFQDKTLNYAKNDDKYIYTGFLPGSLFAIKADVFKAVGGFDDKVFLYYEESILRRKFDKLGYKMAILKNQSFYHMHSVSINKSLAKIKQYKHFCESRYYLFEHYMDCNWLQLLALRIFSAYGFYMRKILYRILY